MKHLLLCLIVCLCCVTSHVARGESPDMGAMLLLSEIDQHKGKVVLLNFFATWCEPCQEEIPGLVRLRRDYPVNKLAVIGISLDEDPSLVAPFVAKYGINYPVKAASGDMVRMFSVRSVPHNTMYDTTGRLVVNQPGLIEEDDFRGVIDQLLEGKP